MIAFLGLRFALDRLEGWPVKPCLSCGSPNRELVFEARYFAEFENPPP